MREAGTRSEEPGDALLIRAVLLDWPRVSGNLALSLVEEVNGVVIGHIAFSPASGEGWSTSPAGYCVEVRTPIFGPVGAADRILQRHQLTRAHGYASSHGGETLQHFLHLAQVHAREAGGEGVRSGRGRCDHGNAKIAIRAGSRMRIE